MPYKSSAKEPAETIEHSTPTVPTGTPSWVTARLIQQTIILWQPYYEENLSSEDAVAIILTIGRLFNVV